MSEYDAKSRPSTPAYRQNFDAIFRTARKERKVRSEKRVKSDPNYFSGIPGVGRGQEGVE